METGEMVQLLLHQGLAVVPGLVGWTGAVVVAMILLRRGGEKAELLLLIGACLMLAATLFQIPLAGIVPFLMERGWGMRDAAQVVSQWSMGLGMVRLAGIACFVYAFWTRFEMGKAPRQQA